MQHICVRMLAMSPHNGLSGQPLNTWSLGQVWNEAHTPALQTYGLQYPAELFSAWHTHTQQRLLPLLLLWVPPDRVKPELCFSKEEDEEDPGCPGYGANTEGGLPWGLSFCLLFQGVCWLVLHPILVPTTFPQGTWSTPSFQLGIWNGNDGWLLSAPWQSQPFQQLQQLLVITLWFENNES